MRTTLALAAVLVALAAPRVRAAPDDLRAAAERAADEIAAALRASPDAKAVRQIALAPLDEPPTLKGYARVVEEVVATRLAGAASVEVMDRAKLAAVVGEQKLGAMFGSGRTGGEAELARLTGAQAVLSGQLGDAGDRLTVQLKLVAAAGGRLLASARREAELPRKGGKGAAVESAGLEVALRKLSDRLAEGFGKLPGSARYRRLAVLTFTEAGDESRRRQVGAVVTAEIATSLRRDHGLMIVERAKLGEVLGELKLQQSLAMDSAQAGRIGKMADAQAVVLGSVSDVGDRHLVNARIVSTDTGETLAADSQSIAAASLVALSSDAVVLRSRSGAVFRSILVPGFGQFYNRQQVKGWLVLGTEVALLGGALGYHLAGKAAYEDYRSASRETLGAAPSAEAARRYDLATSRYSTRNWLLVGAAGVWALNVVDAYLSGVDGEAALSGRADAASRPIPSLAVIPAPGGALAMATLRF